MKTPDNVTNVPMNSPECIKKKLNSYSARYLSGNNWGREISGTGEIMHNAFFLIQQLESRLAQAERERDAAVDCIQKVYTMLSKPAETVTAARLHAVLALYAMNDYFRDWRGVCPENTKEEINAN